MNPQTKIMEQEVTEESPSQEQYVRQVEDHSRPAQEILTDEQQGRKPEEAPVLFVP